MVIEICVETSDWQVYIYDTNDVYDKTFSSFKEVLTIYGYDYKQVISHWKNRRYVQPYSTNSFILLDDSNEIYAIKFGRNLFIDINYRYENLDPTKFSFLVNIKNILDIVRRDEKIKAVINI